MAVWEAMANSMLDALEIGYAIKDRRAELGLTQAQLAETAGVSKRCLWSLELGRNPGVQLDKLIAVLGALGLDLVIDATGGAESSAHPEKIAASNDTNHVLQTPTDTTPDTSPAEESATIDAVAILTGGKR